MSIFQGAMALLYNETQIDPSGDAEALRWNDPIAEDSLGSPVCQTDAYQVSTLPELALILEQARERQHVVRVVGAATSSKAFVPPPRELMEHFGKRGVTLVGFNPRGDFGRIFVDMDRAEVVVGPAVSLQAMDDEVRRQTTTDNGVTRARLMNLMKITTMGAGAVATALGSGGVSDGGDCSNTLMLGSRWMDSRGVLHSENYTPRLGDYFSEDTSSFARVNHLQVGREMTGRGGPFGIGVEARFRLVEAPIGTHTVIYGFHGNSKTVRDELEAFSVQMNHLNDRLRLEQAPLQLLSLELMNRDALHIASEGMNGWSLPLSGGEPEFAVIADFAQYDWWDGDHAVLASDAVVEELFELGFFPKDSLDTATYVLPKDAEKVRTFRLQGPEHMRMIFKRLQREARVSGTPMPGTESTDWAVDPRDPALVNWYFERFFQLSDKVRPHVVRGAIYGHLFNRLDLHGRDILIDPREFGLHAARLTEFGMQVVQRQKRGERVRVRGEKLELPFGRDLKCIGMQREGAHRDSNVRLLERIDPTRTFIPLSPERWGGKYDWK